MKHMLVKPLNEEEMAVVCGGVFATSLNRVGMLGTYISILSWAEKFGEGLGDGLYFYIRGVASEGSEVGLDRLHLV